MRSRTLRALAAALALLAPAATTHAAALFSRLDPATTRLLAATSAVTGGAAGSASGASLLAVDEPALAAFRAAGGGTLSVPDAAGGSVELELSPYDLFGPDGGMSYTDDSGRHRFTPDVSLFRGHVAGDPKSLVVMAMGSAGVQAVIQSGERRFTISPAQRALAPSAAATAGVGVHVFAPEGDLSAAISRFECGINADNEAAYTMPTEPFTLPGRGATPDGVQLNATRLSFRVAVDCDYEIYSTKFATNLPAATTYIMTVLGTVNLIYERDLEATLIFPFVNLWTTAADPYTQPTTQTELPEFQSYWQATFGLSSSTYRMAHLISGRGLGGGIAFLDAVCSGNGYGVSAIDATYSYPTTTTTWDIVVVAHEMGHNLGSPHTHSCIWSGLGLAPPNSTLDSCVAPEGSCATYSNHLPPDKGTIMSYCHLIGGTANGIRLAFHPACVTRMRGIMGGCTTPPAVFPPKNPIATNIASGLRLSWSTGGSPSVLGYSVVRSRLPLDLGSAYLGSTSGLTYDTPGLGTYYYRMRTLRAADSSSFSAEVKATACAFTNGAPVVVGSQPNAAISEDFNQDGIQDVALVTTFGGNLVTLLGQGSAGVGNGSFAAPVLTPTGPSPACLAALDVNADGILDLIVGAGGDNTLVVHLGQGSAGVGNGSFGPATPLATMSFAPTGIAVSDFDEDGLPDLVVAGGGSFVATLRGQGTAGVPNGTFGPAVAVNTVSNSKGVLPYDLNGDGITDLAVTGSGMRLLFGNGTGGKGDGTFTLGPSYSTGSSPKHLATGDFNLDGIADVAVCNTGESTVSVFLGNGSGGVPNGTFAAAIPVASGAGPNAVQVADWDDDGVPDLAFASNNATNSTSILLGRGNGTFDVPQTFPVGANTPVSIAVNDFNEDGTPDLFVCNQGSQSVSRQLAGCSGVLSSAITVTAPNGGESWSGGTEHTIAWTKGTGVMTVDVQLSTDGGSHWRTLARGLTGTSFAWTATGPTTSAARVRVVDSHSAQFADASDADFQLWDPSVVGTEPQPARLALLGAWPNPARADLSVAFTLPVGDARGALELLDLAGRRVAERDLAGLGAGRHTLALLERRFVTPGVYLVRLRHGGQVRSMKVAVLR